MARLMQLGANHSHAMQLYESYSVKKTTVAAFLISRGPSAAIVLQPYDRPMVKTPFTLEGVDANADPGNDNPSSMRQLHASLVGSADLLCGCSRRPFDIAGTPLGPGKADASGKVFTRAYTKADVTLDCNSFTATIDFKP